MARSPIARFAHIPCLPALLLLITSGLGAQTMLPSSLSNGTIGEPLNGSGYVLQVSPEACVTRTWTVTAGALPQGVTLTQPQTGSLSALLSGTPSQTGTFSFTVTASAGTGCTLPPPVPPVVQSYTLTIDPLVLQPASLPDGAVGSGYEAPSFLPGPAQTCFTYAITSGTLPPGLTLTEYIYFGYLTGTPTTAGVYTFTVTATESSCQSSFVPGRTAARSYTVRILGISTSSLPQGTAGRPYPNTQLAVAGNSGTVSYGGTLLPPTLAVSATGLITGTTTTAGTYNAAFTVIDPSTNLVASRTLPIVVNAGPTFPTATLPGGTVGASYSASVAASGGTAPFIYTLSAVAGGLPPGLSLATGGAITGNPTTAGTYNFSIIATDANGAAVPQSFQIVVAPAPVLTISPSTLPTGVMGSFYYAGLSADGFFSPPSFSVSSGSLPPGIALTTAGVFQGTPSQAGLFSFTVRAASASTGQSTTRDYQIQVVGALSFVTPTVLPGAQVGTPYHLDFQAAGGRPPYYFFVETVNIPGLQFNGGETANLDGTPTTAGTYTFDVFLYDSTESSASRTFSVTVAPPPSITTASLPNAFVGKGYQATLAASGFVSSPTWSVVEGQLPDGLALSASTGTITGTPTAEGSYPFQVRAVAGNQVVGPKSLSITVGVPGLDFTPDLLTAGTVGVPYSQMFTPSGGSGVYVFTLAGGTPPPGLGVGADGSVTGTPTTVGSYQFVVRLSAGNQVIERLITLFIDATALELTPSTLPDGNVGQNYSQALVPSGGTAPFLFQVNSGSLPANVVIDPATGTIAGKPTTAGLYTFEILLTDANHKQLVRPYSITIHAGPTQPGTVLPDGTQGEVYPGAQIKTAGGTAPFTFTLSAGALPVGLALAQDGGIAGTPLNAGDFTFDVTVTDATGKGSVGTYSIRVFATLDITPDTLPDGLLIRDYSAQLSVTGGAPSYVFELVSGSLPDGIQFDAGSFRGAPTKAGSFEFDIKVTDSRQRTTTKHYTITVKGGPSLNVQGTPPGGVVGVAYQTSFTTQGGTQPFRWSFTGTLPPGLSMDAATGNLAGIPTAIGTFPFSVRVDDANNLSATGSFTITVSLAQLPPVTFNPVQPNADPGSQITVGLTLTNPYPVALNGVLTLTFAPDSGFDDPAVLFASGSRTLPFTIPAGTTGASFQVPNSAFQTGTVAGLVTIVAALTVQGSDVTPTPVPTQQVRIVPAAPVITRIDLTKTGTGFELTVYGFATPRQVSSATVKLGPAAGKTLASTDFPFTVNQIFTTYFADQASAPFGSQFRLVLPFTVSDITGIGSATVTLTNSVGTSAPVTVSF
ncbi:putative Ig domain-containing protein [uncultured Paludibaculum sp.]|uniref:putative Ig domain-containing protein n=1 Tax=uncultured Paludibaculum sp. TaxID=1765020 RepID=UPI002AAC2DA4|nr:putative Ig domain-containing protein [uncultured Paludibaculum sp.]